MAVRLRQRTDPVRSLVDEARELYVSMFDAPAKVNWNEDNKPVIIGPTWEIDDNGYFVLPKLTLGYECLYWCYENLHLTRGSPWTFTHEQARFILWYYELLESGKFAYRDAVLQRIKGWGKDPVGCCICLFEMLGPCRFAGWADDGSPLAIENPQAWVQTAAVALEQTKNTMRLIPGLVTPEAKKKYGLQIGKEQVYALNGERFFQAVTSSPATLEGARGTFVLLNETQHWNKTNAGHEMSEVIDRNATKSPDGAARSLRITNAYMPGFDSVAERDRTAYDSILEDGFKIGLMYDSLEANAKAELTQQEAPKVVEVVRGDSIWLDKDRIVQTILDPRHDASLSRRYWFNQITASEDKWMESFVWDGRFEHKEVKAQSMVALGFDGSRSRNNPHSTTDATAIVACRISDGHIFIPESEAIPKCIWEHPKGQKQWQVPAEEVDRTIDKLFMKYNVVSFFADPAKWETWVAQWESKYGKRLKAKATQEHPIQWWMTGGRSAQVVKIIEQFENAVYDDELTHDGNLVLSRHVKNAYKRPSSYGMQISKEHPDSHNKIDAAVAAILAYEARRQALAKGVIKRGTVGDVVRRID